jgi:hypothetical protein
MKQMQQEEHLEVYRRVIDGRVLKIIQPGHLLSHLVVQTN